MLWFDVSLSRVGVCGRRLGRAAFGAILSTLLVASVGAAEDDELVVPGGQDELLAHMLGRGVLLRGQCRFAGGGANGPFIESTYRCPEGMVVFELVHPTAGAPGAVYTERFAITVLSGRPPGGLVAAVASSVRSAEGAFVWTWRIGGDAPASRDDRGD